MKAIKQRIENQNTKREFDTEEPIFVNHTGRLEKIGPFVFV